MLSFILFILPLVMDLESPNTATNAESAFENMVEVDSFERGYSKIRYDLDHNGIPVVARIYPSMGCALIFDRPYDDTWASDQGGAANGKYYSYLEWGTNEYGTAPDHKKVVVSNVVKAQEPVNLFFLFGDHVLEVILLQADALHEADRIVRFQIVGGKEPKPRNDEIQVGLKPRVKRETPQEELPRKDVADESEKKIAEAMALPPQEGNHHKRVRHGNIIYNFDRQPGFVYFSPKPNSPEITTLEVIKGIKPKLQRNFSFAYPVPTTETYQVAGNTIMLFPNFSLDDKERLYLRTKADGEKVATTSKLKKERI